MNYSWKRVWWQLKYHWKVYLFIALEYAAGIAVLVTCMNIFYSSRDTLRELKQQMTDEAIPVTCSGGQSFMGDGDFPVTYENYLQLSEKFSEDLRIAFAQYFSSAYFVKRELIQLNILFMNENMFEDLFGYRQKEGIVYVGKRAYEDIQTLTSVYKNGKFDENVTFIDNDLLSFAKGEISLQERAAYTMELLQENPERTEISTGRMGEAGIPIESCIVFPLDSVQYVREAPISSANSLLTIRYLDNDTGEEKLAALVSDLSLAREGYQFNVADQYLLTRGSMEDLNLKYETYLLVACAVLAIVINGVTGILLIYLYRRKKSMAISLAYGATFGRIAGELLLEIAIILLSGCILGLAGAFLYHSHIYLYYTEVYFYPECIGLTLGISFTGSLFSCFLALTGVKKEAPIQVLKDS